MTCLDHTLAARVSQKELGVSDLVWGGALRGRVGRAAGDTALGIALGGAVLQGLESPTGCCGGRCRWGCCALGIALEEHLGALCCRGH